MIFNVQRRLLANYSPLKFWLIGSSFFFIFSCNKLVHIPPPPSSITTSQVFADSSDAAAAISGIYSSITYRPLDKGFCNGSLTIYCGVSSDELVPSSNDVGDLQQFYTNSLLAENGTVDANFWRQPYSYIYQTNACIEGLNASKTIPTTVKNQFLGEAKFLRALFYFYLVNLFGDVPYVNSTTWATTSLSKRVSKSDMYQQIVADLKEAQSLLPSNYNFSNGLRTRANQWAATALLARVYLYTGDWTDAKIQASSIINTTGVFSLASDLNNVFLVNSTEAILQWQLNTNYGYYTVTAEGYDLIPPTDGSEPPLYYISDQLLNSFEVGDNRKKAWIDSVQYSGFSYYFPYKYKNGRFQQSIGGTASEYYTVLRLAEQYLIRAEALAKLNDLGNAIADLNVIRNRAGLPDLVNLQNQSDVLNAIAKERKIELFSEWGHRWFDLKRTGQVDSVMSVVAPQKLGGSQWRSYQQLYPIPQGETNIDPNLTQNIGY